MWYRKDSCDRLVYWDMDPKIPQTLPKDGGTVLFKNIVLNVLGSACYLNQWFCKFYHTNTNIKDMETKQSTAFKGQLLIFNACVIFNWTISTTWSIWSYRKIWTIEIRRTKKMIGSNKRGGCHFPTSLSWQIQ